MSTIVLFIGYLLMPLEEDDSLQRAVIEEASQTQFRVAS